MRQNQVCDQGTWIWIKFIIRKVGLKSISDPESRAKIHFRSILWGQNPFFDLRCPVLIRKIDLLPRLWFKKIHFRSIFVGQNPFFDLRCPVLIRKIDLLSRLWFKKIHFRSILWGQNPFFDLKCPVLIRKIDLLSRLWFKSLRLVHFMVYETRWLPIGYR